MGLRPALIEQIYKLESVHTLVYLANLRYCDLLDTVLMISVELQQIKRWVAPRVQIEIILSSA
jgi:hypothetical protein